MEKQITFEQTLADVCTSNRDYHRNNELTNSLNRSRPTTKHFSSSSSFPIYSVIYHSYVLYLLTYHSLKRTYSLETHILLSFHHQNPSFDGCNFPKIRKKNLFTLLPFFWFNFRGFITIFPKIPKSSTWHGLPSLAPASDAQSQSH